MLVEGRQLSRARRSPIPPPDRTEHQPGGGLEVVAELLRFSALRELAFVTAREKECAASLPSGEPDQCPSSFMASPPETVAARPAQLPLAFGSVSSRKTVSMPASRQRIAYLIIPRQLVGRVPVQVVPCSVVEPRRPQVCVPSRVLNVPEARASMQAECLPTAQPRWRRSHETGNLRGCTCEASLCPYVPSARR